MDECQDHKICECFKLKIQVLEKKLEIAKRYLEERCPNGVSLEALVHMAEAHLGTTP